MDRRLLLAAALLLVVGALLLGQGLTGRAVSQSCCAGPFCDAKYLCDFAEAAQGSTDANMALGLVLTLVAITAVAFAAHRR